MGHFIVWFKDKSFNRSLNQLISTLLNFPGFSDAIPGWYRGFSTKNRAVKGIFPSTYVHLKPCKIDSEGLFESVIPLEDPVVREVTLVLREWGGIWKRLYVVSIFCPELRVLSSPAFSYCESLCLCTLRLKGIFFVIKNCDRWRENCDVFLFHLLCSVSIIQNWNFFLVISEIYMYILKFMKVLRERTNFLYLYNFLNN